LNWKGSDKNVCISDPDGRLIHELTDLESVVIAVAASACNGFIAGAAMNGKVAIWKDFALKYSVYSELCELHIFLLLHL